VKYRSQASLIYENLIQSGPYVMFGLEPSLARIGNKRLLKVPFDFFGGFFFFFRFFLISSCSFPIFVLSPHILHLIGNRNGNAEISSERLCFALLIQVLQAQQEPAKLKALQRSLLGKTRTRFFLRGMIL